MEFVVLHQKHSLSYECVFFPLFLFCVILTSRRTSGFSPQPSSQILLKALRMNECCHGYLHPEAATVEGEPTWLPLHGSNHITNTAEFPIACKGNQSEIFLLNSFMSHRVGNLMSLQFMKCLCCAWVNSSIVNSTHIQ